MERGDQVGAPRERLPLPRVPGAAAALHSLPLARDCPPAGSLARGVRAPRFSVWPSGRARRPQGSATAGEPDCNQGPKLGAGGGAKEAVIYKRLLPDLACLLSEQAALSITHPAGWKNTSLAGPGAGPGVEPGRGRGALPLPTRGHTYVQARAHTHTRTPHAHARTGSDTQRAWVRRARARTPQAVVERSASRFPHCSAFFRKPSLCNPWCQVVQPVLSPFLPGEAPQSRLCAAPQLCPATEPQYSFIHLAPGRGLCFPEWQSPNHSTASSRATFQVLSLKCSFKKWTQQPSLAASPRHEGDLRL